MTNNIILRSSTIADIDNRVQRVIRGLGNPEPPLSLEQVRELLSLDRQFYTAEDPNLSRELFSRVRVAGIQVFKRPSLLMEAIQKLSLKALYIPDVKRILLDSTLPVPKHRWNEAHEIGHSLLPWHGEVLHGDTSRTLSLDCQEEIEAEANFAAGRLLFLQDKFEYEARDRKVGLSTVQELRKIFGNTLTTTFYRYVETMGTDHPTVGLITPHPHPLRRPIDFDPANPCRYFIRSKSFMNRFSRISVTDLFPPIAAYCGAQGGGPLGCCELLLTDDNGIQQRFQFETFFNKYDALTLGRYIGEKSLIIPVL